MDQTFNSLMVKIVIGEMPIIRAQLGIPEKWLERKKHNLYMDVRRCCFNTIAPR